MNIDTFIRRWSASTRNEAANAKPHFLDLCELLDVPPPTEDPDGSVYAFEKAVAKANGRKGWADVWRRDCFGWEYKSKGGDLEAAHDQLLRYAGALGNPPLLIASDMARIMVRTNFTNTVTQALEIDLEALRDASVRDRLRDCWLAPDRWKPGTTRQALTERAAGDFAALAERLRKRGHHAETVAHFVNRLVFCLFANDVRLLPAGMLGELLAIAQQEPAGFAEAAGMLFRAMKEPGGRIGFRPVPWFNGGLFDDDTALPLLAEDITLLNKAAANDWSQIDPSIFGTLFERGLDPSKRSQLGAHYTDRAKIELLVGAVITRPLIAEWEAVKAEIAVRMDERAAFLKASPAATEAALVLAGADAITAETQTARKGMRRAADQKTRKVATLFAEADTLYRSFLARLRAFRVLDPACGSGNFLYVSMLDLKNLELRVSVDAEAMGLEPSFPAIGPEAVLGIEINPYAAELARVSVWIGHIQWARRHGYPPPSNPVLRKLDTIICQDAILDEKGENVRWPACSAVVGNPPFLGQRFMRRELGSYYVDSIRSNFPNYLTGNVDFVVYWFSYCEMLLSQGFIERAGLVSTNSIRGGDNQAILQRICQNHRIYWACSDEAWFNSGTAVRVSMVCFEPKSANTPAVLNGKDVKSIDASLSKAGTNQELTHLPLNTNQSIAFSGFQANGPFDIPGNVAREWMLAPVNPNGQPNSDVLRPIINAADLVRRNRDEWVIDFGNRSKSEASLYEMPFLQAEQFVKPARQQKREANLRENWWKHKRTSPAMRRAVYGLPRFLATPMVSKYRLFRWLKPAQIPENTCIVFARADDAFFGILSSRFHELWSLRYCTWMGVGNDPRYTPSSTFETFPFPTGFSPNLPLSDWEANAHFQAITHAASKLNELREKWLNPPDIVKWLPEVAPGFPHRALPVSADAAKILQKRTLTNLYNAGQHGWMTYIKP